MVNKIGASPCINQIGPFLCSQSFNPDQNLQHQNLDQHTHYQYGTTCTGRGRMTLLLLPPLGVAQRSRALHYVKPEIGSRSTCNGSLTPVTCTHICNGCYLAPVTHKRGRTAPGFATTTHVTNEDYGNRLLKRLLHEFFVTDVKVSPLQKLNLLVTRS
jgi:hypothetical protein